MAEIFEPIPWPIFVTALPTPPGTGVNVYDVINPPKEGLLWPPRGE